MSSTSTIESPSGASGNGQGGTQAVDRAAALLTYVIEALRAIVNQGADLLSLGPELLGMGVWMVITFVIAVRLFRWE